MNREIKAKFVIDNRYLSRTYTIEDILKCYEEDIFEEMEKCDCALTESNPYCEGDCIQFENSKITGIIQYTGLKDKLGKEIYEGDIVKCFDKIGEVCYHAERASFIFRDGFNELLFWKFPLEILGNIYENPDLIISKK